MMPIHNIDWRTNVSGVEDMNVMKNAIQWLCGTECKLNVEELKSFHGSTFYSIHGRYDASAAARKSVARLGNPVLNYMLENIDSRLDEENCYHLRLNTKSLIAGKIKIVEKNDVPSIKVRMKIKVFPNEDPVEKCRTLFEIAKKYNKNNL